MCLRIQKTKHQRVVTVVEPVVTQKDITTFKVGKYITGGKEFRSEFQHHTYKFSTLYKNGDTREIPPFVKASGEIDGTAFHSYDSLETARARCGCLVPSEPKPGQLYIVECVIPKGSMVYYGISSDIASSAIILKDWCRAPKRKYTKRSKGKLVKRTKKKK